ncbi:transcriptional regulator [Opitutaceae bacterium TAV1]|nr:transcriptional regulator [Opitutaceae bacterium TAV1]
MTTFDWPPIIRSIVLDREGGIPLHVQLRTSLRRAIQAVPPHVEKLAPENTLITLLGVSQATVRKALDGLVEEGLIQRRRALGTIITRNRPAFSSARRAGKALRTDDSFPAPEAAAAPIPHPRLAIISPAHASYSNSGHLAALTAQANARGVSVILVSFEKGEDWRSSRSRIGFGPAEGGVVFLGGFNPATVHDLHAILSGQGYRTVCVGLPPEGCSCPAVGIDNRAFVRLGLERLRDAGHRRIAFLIGEPEEHPEVRERIRHFEELARALDLPDAEVIHGGATYGDSSAETASRAATTLWQQRSANRRPSVLFGVSDECVAGALYGLAHLGVRIPRDVSLLGYDGTNLTRIVQPELATLVTPMDAFAAAIFSLLDLPASSKADTPSTPREILIAPGFRPGPSLQTLA